MMTSLERSSTRGPDAVTFRHAAPLARSPDPTVVMSASARPSSADRRSRDDRDSAAAVAFRASRIQRGRATRSSTRASSIRLSRVSAPPNKRRNRGSRGSSSRSPPLVRRNNTLSALLVRRLQDSSSVGLRDDAFPPSRARPPPQPRSCASAIPPRSQHRALLHMSARRCPASRVKKGPLRRSSNYFERLASRYPHERKMTRIRREVRQSKLGFRRRPRLPTRLQAIDRLGANAGAPIAAIGGGRLIHREAAGRRGLRSVHIRWPQAWRLA